MKEDKKTKPELNKEEYLESLFNGAKDELEAYIVSNDQSDSDEKSEEQVNIDTKSENSDIIESKNNLENISESKLYNVSNISNSGSDASETDDDSDIDQHIEDDFLESDIPEAEGVSQTKESEKLDELETDDNEKSGGLAEKKSKSDIDLSLIHI